MCIAGYCINVSFNSHFQYLVAEKDYKFIVEIIKIDKLLVHISFQLNCAKSIVINTPCTQYCNAKLFKEHDEELIMKYLIHAGHKLDVIFSMHI